MQRIFGVQGREQDIGSVLLEPLAVHIRKLTQRRTRTQLCAALECLAIESDEVRRRHQHTHRLIAYVRLGCGCR